MSKKIAIFPGSFDPITVGHCDIVKRAIPLFDSVIVAIGVNTQKKYLFSFIQLSISHNDDTYFWSSWLLLSID